MPMNSNVPAITSHVDNTMRLIIDPPITKIDILRPKFEPRRFHVMIEPDFT